MLINDSEVKVNNRLLPANLVKKALVKMVLMRKVILILDHEVINFFVKKI